MAPKKTELVLTEAQQREVDESGRLKKSALDNGVSSGARNAARAAPRFIRAGAQRSARS